MFAGRSVEAISYDRYLRIRDGRVEVKRPSQIRVMDVAIGRVPTLPCDGSIAEIRPETGLSQTLRPSILLPI
jgi:hypothetical protein